MMRLIFSLSLFLFSLPALRAQGMVLQSVETEGLKRTHPGFFYGIADASPGDTVTYEALEEMRRWLVLQPAFNAVAYHLDTTVIGGISEFNFLGRGISVGAYYQYNLRHSLGLFYRHPFLVGKFGAEVSYTLWNSYEPLYKGPATAWYDYSNSSLNATAFFTPTRRQEYQVGISLFQEGYRLGTVAEEDRPLFPRELDIGKLGIRANHFYRGAVPHYFYWSGLSVDTYSQVVLDELGSEPFYIIRQAWKYYRRAGERGNWALRFIWGLSTNVNTPFAPFALDNHISIRGVGDRIDRGTGMLTLNTEYRYTLLENSQIGLQAVGFVDAGSWRLPGGTFSDFADPEIIRLHGGVGGRFILKQFYNTVFSADYGHSLRGTGMGGFVLGLGQYF